MAFRMPPTGATVQLQCPAGASTLYEGMDAPTAMCSNCYKKRRDHTALPGTEIEPQKPAAQAPQARAVTAAAASVTAPHGLSALIKPQKAGEPKAAAAPKPVGEGGGSSGFAAGLKPSNDNARVVSGKFAPDAISRPNSISLSPLSDVEFFYFDANGNQIGPASLKELRAKFKSGEINPDCLYWYNGMNGWEKVGDNAELMRVINPPAPPPRPPSFGVNPPARPVFSEPSTPDPTPSPAPVLPVVSTTPAEAPKPAKFSLSPAASSPGASASARPNPFAAPSPTPASSLAPQSTAPAEAPKPAKFSLSPAASSPGASASARPNPFAAPSPTPASSLAPQSKMQASPAKFTLPASSSKPRAPASKSDSWVEKRTADLVAYYYNAYSGALQWERPAELGGGGGAEAAGGGQGGLVWVPDEVEGFIVARSMGGKSFQTLDGRTVTFTVPKGVVLQPVNHASLSLFQDDLVLLQDMSEGMILHNLRERYFKDQIYCGVGSILIAINPFKRLPLYTPDIIQKYNKRGNKVMPPHPFDIADSAYKTLLEVNKDQSILVSGESGAGKTEVTKQCLMFLAEVAGSKANIEQRVLSVNPILEAFGNAKTLRNDNSSRFGRFSEIIMDQDRRIAGAQIRSYLLEKSRVSYQQAGERNYHIFYQLCRSSLASYYGLGGPEHYGYLAHSGCCDIKGVDDANDFNEVCSSMDSLGFTAEEKHSILSIVSGIIQLGNITFSAALFKGQDGGTADGSTIDDVNAAYAVAVSLGCDAATLQDALTHRTLEIMGQAPIKVPLRTDQAIENRDALAKYVYEKVFQWLVARINQSLAPSGQKSNFIGILDIFGFEIFKQNSFEQLCINFCNEKLQQLFNEDTFKNEEAVYKSEGVEFPPIVFIDNQPVVDLIEIRGGIFTVLDDVVKAPGKQELKDAKFGSTLDTNFKANPIFVASNQHKGISYTAFSINHYAGTVTYDVDRFVEKNKDSLFSDLYDMMSNSQDPLIRSQFAAPQGGKRTLASEFKSQLGDLMKGLRATESHFIRCIKANSQKKPRIFEGASCLEQLKCAGVFEAVTIRKNGYPFRYSFQRFVERYKCIMATEEGWVPLKSKQRRDQCYEIITTSKQSFPNMQWGHTMLFFRADEYRILELCRALATDRTSAKIQAMARGRLTRRYLKLVQACRPKLRAACQSRDVKQLEAALAHVNSQLGAFAVFSIAVPIAEWANAKELLVVIREAIRLEPELQMWVYSDLQEDNNFEMLFKVYKTARVIAPKHPRPQFDELYNMAVEQFNGWRDYRLTPRMEAVMKSLERDEMGSVYAECKRLEFEDPRLVEIEKFMGLGKEALIKMQYKRALETGQAQRVIMKEIELKELCLEQFHDNFLFEKCSLLREPAEYAAAKFISFKRDELEKGFFVHSIHSLITSLTSLEDPVMVKEALACFKCILGYCGDRRATYPESNAIKVLQVGIEGGAHMRAEIFAQLMKQCNQNPNPQNCEKVWGLMMLCLLHFPPGEAMENIVQTFIRDHLDPSRSKDALIKQCHQSAYSDPALAPPAVDMIPSLLKQNGF